LGQDLFLKFAGVGGAQDFHVYLSRTYHFSCFSLRTARFLLYPYLMVQMAPLRSLLLTGKNRFRPACRALSVPLSHTRCSSLNTSQVLDCLEAVEC